MRLFPIAAALTLAACAGVQSTQYFVLPDSRYVRPARQGAETAVRVNLAAALRQNGLLYQTGPYRVHFAQNHVWASPLDGMIAAHLSNLFNRRHPEGIYAPAAHGGGRTLTVNIESFQGSHTGKAAVGGYAVLPDGGTRPFYAETPQQGDGYDAMVRALTQSLDKAARQISD